MKDLKDKVAVITGAASGIGLGLAKRCVQEGCKLVLADIEEAALKQAKHDLERAGADILTVVTDVAQVEEMERLAQITVDTFGAVHMLFNNAGVAGADAPLLWETSLADWEWVFGVNLWGVIHGIRAFVPIMIEQDDECHIVNTASLAGLVSMPGIGTYSATKHAVVTLSETLYQDLSRIEAKVNVSVLCPAGVNTRIGDSSRNRPAGSSDSSPLLSNDLPSSEIREKWWEQIWEDAIEPDQVADVVFNAIRNEVFYILTHPEYNETVRTRYEDILKGRLPTNLFTIPLS